MGVSGAGSFELGSWDGELGVLELGRWEFGVMELGVWELGVWSWGAGELGTRGVEKLVLLGSRELGGSWGVGGVGEEVLGQIESL